MNPLSFKNWDFFKRKDPPKKKEEFKYTAFISTLAPFDIKNNREEKKKLIASFNAMAELIHLARV